MVNQPMQRLARALVVARLGPKEIQEILAQLRTNPASEAALIAEVEAMQHRRAAKSPRARDASDDWVRYVIHQVVEEAHIPPVEAGQLLRQALLQSGFPKVPAFRERDGLPVWLRRLSKAVPPSDVMHFATRIARSRSSGEPLPWKLPERERGNSDHA